MLTVLFGSGADSCFCPSLKSGASFSEALIYDSFAVIRKSLYGEHLKDFKLVYPGSKNVFLKTILSNKEEAEDVFGKAVVLKCEDYYNTKNKNIREDVEEYCRKWYRQILKKEEHREKESDFFLKYAVFFDALDEKFNSLRERPLNSNAKRVISAYTTVFLLMLHSLYNIPSSFIWNFKNVMDLLQKPYDICNPSNDSYYHILRDSGLTADVVTTNYTSVGEQVIGGPVTYLHGKLTWFEDYKNLTVYDCEDKSEKKIALKNSETIMPFILIPSGVKPIICKKQLNEFHKFIDDLEKTDWLCSIGYRFNSEDNHINSIIADWLRGKRKRLVCFNYNNNVKFSKLEMFAPFNLVELPYHSGLFSEMNMDEGVFSIGVTEDNSKGAFKDFLDSCKKREEN